ncbi:E3 ubiquitin/ISG15 ligase TRIM25 isoform X2 [Phyllopteryx taeniolatus]|uniref:E3 ubiquitin/ISG15 ligase TRIM25 isoform X2 n=1 Tax=Phyllopteryx taeniolatus TaxID=161469 RepID=UPI002AD3E136|nr:E3 ubiquitin/ISG15 ligase TRIM25 isoform X2 [Phyllopteryx taeniolatus]
MTHQGTANLYSALPADTDDHSAVANMASGPSDQSDVLQDELTCPVCLDVFHDPHLLPCGHNFCKMCLDRLRRLTDQSRFQCPECRDSHRCNRSFQKNFKLANIALDFRRRRRAAAVDATAQPPKECVASTPTGQQDYVPCDYCPPPSGAGASADAGFSQERGDMQESAAPSGAAVKMCLKCEVSMCPEHVKPHLELPAFREHPLTEPMRDFWKRKCPDHDEIFRYYCLDDKVCVCNACTIEGRHLGHTIKTLKNTMKDIKEVLNKQLHKTEKKYGMAKKKLHEQTEKERQNKKFLEDAEGCLARLRQDLEEKVSAFVSRLMQCTRTNCETIGPAIQKNISRICQDLARLREVRCGIKSLVQENDPFRFIEAYKTTGRQCRKQLKRSMFYPEYVDMDPGLLGIMMEEELQKFLDLDLTFYVFAAINFICQRSDIAEERGENEDVARQADDDDDNNDDNDDDDDDDNDDDSSEEEMSGDEEEEGEEEEENEGHELSESDDELYVPEEEEEAQEEEEEDDREEEDDDDEEDGEERD